MDKHNALITVFSADGRQVGSAPVLLGLTPGDQEAPGARQKPPDALKPHERITPAGRFPTVPGRNLNGERVLWIDYEAGLAIHRLRPAPARERRPERLASRQAEAHRITLGCVVVDGAFFDTVVLPTLGREPAWVHILPERLPMSAWAGPSSALAHAALPAPGAQQPER